MNTKPSAFKATYGSSYSRLNISECHANGWVLLMLKKGKWQAMDSDTLYNSRDSAPPTLRAYFNTHINLSFEQVVAPPLSSDDLFVATEFAPITTDCRKITDIGTVDIYEFGVANIYSYSGTLADSMDDIKQATIDALTNTVLTCEYAKAASLDIIQIESSNSAEETAA